MNMALPETIRIKEEEIRIDTDFRRWMDMQRVFLAPQLTPWERQNVALINGYGFLPKLDYEAYLEGLIWFYSRGEPALEEAPREHLLDWEKDFGTIWADFRLYYRMDLHRQRKLHWWAFLDLFSSLPPDAEIKRRISLRSIDPGKIRDAGLREQVQKAKKAVALYSDGLEDIDSFYQRML